jgi:hypothetical protein
VSRVIVPARAGRPAEPCPLDHAGPLQSAHATGFRYGRLPTGTCADPIRPKTLLRHLAKGGARPDRCGVMHLVCLCLPPGPTGAGRALGF